MKQIGLAVAQYTQDYDEKLPIFNATDNYAGSNAFMSSTAKANPLRDLQPYLKSIQVYDCPSAKVGASAVAGQRSAYLLNGVLATSTGCALATVRRPGEIVYAQENVYANANSYARPGDGTAGAAKLLGSGTAGRFTHWHEYYAAPVVSDGVTISGEIYNSQHFDGGTLLFADGHVKWRKNSSLRSRDFGLTLDEAWSATNQDNQYDTDLS